MHLSNKAGGIYVEDMAAGGTKLILLLVLLAIFGFVLTRKKK